MRYYRKFEHLIQQNKGRAYGIHLFPNANWQMCRPMSTKEWLGKGYIRISGKEAKMLLEDRKNKKDYDEDEETGGMTIDGKAVSLRRLKTNIENLLNIYQEEIIDLDEALYLLYEDTGLDLVNLVRVGIAFKQMYPDLFRR